MKIAKEFRWEMGHRLPYHTGKCKNLHGHSYKMMIEFNGDVNGQGMVMDYYEVKEVIQPLIEELDHGFMVKNTDQDLITALEQLNSKHTIVDFDPTAENLCGYFLGKIKKLSLPESIKKIKVRIFETETTYAEDEMEL